MARWEKRLAAFAYARCGRTKGDRLIATGKFRAKRSDGEVIVDLDSVDTHYDNLPDATVSLAPHRQFKKIVEADYNLNRARPMHRHRPIGMCRRPEESSPTSQFPHLQYPRGEDLQSVCLRWKLVCSAAPAISHSHPE